MKKILKRTSAMLAAVMTVTSMGLTALADNYTDSEVYYNDFSSGEVNSTAVIDPGANAYLVDFSASNIASRYFENNAPTAEISDGKLKIKSNGGYYASSGQNGRTRSVTYIKFDKDFDVSANTSKKLIISYDVTLNDFDFYDEKNTYMGNIQRYLFDAGLFEYKDSKTAAEGVFAGGSSGGNAANIGMAFQIPYTNTETNKAEKAGLLIATGNSTPMQSGVGVGHGGSGIFNKPLGNVFHVEYEVTPATETAEPRITKITMSDSEDSTAYNTPTDNTAFNITGKTKISGIRLDTWRGATYDIDNIKAYYEGTLAAPTAVYNNVDLNGATVSGTSFNAQINFTQPITEEDAAAITVNGASVSAQLSEDKKIVTAEISGLKYNSSYVLNVPETALNKAAQFAFETEKSAMYVQDFSDGAVTTVINRNNTWAQTVDLDSDNIVNMRRGTNSTAASIENGKLKIVSNEYDASNEEMSRTFVKFNKDYDISANATDKLIVGYDLSIDDVYLPEEGANVPISMIGGGLFQYVDENTAATGVFTNMGGIIGNASNFGMAIQAPSSQSGTKAERAGLFLRTGNKAFATQPEGVYKDLEFAGIFNKPLGHKFHVEYEITPATDSAEPRVTKVTISDDTDSVYYVADNPVYNGSYKWFDITGKTAISGIRFDAWQSASYSVDNISVGYDWAYNAPEVTYGDNIQLDKSMTVGTDDKTFTYTVNKNCEITDLSEITLKDENGNDIAVNAVNNNGTVTINVTGDLAADTAYTLTLPNTATGAISTIDKFEYNFRTKWETKNFAKPELFKDKTGLNVVFLGGSITADLNGYRNDVEDMIKTQYPDSVFTNAGVGGTGSDYGWTRLKKDVISNGPDLVFVEFTVNDANNKQTTRYMESIVRNLNKLDNPPAIVFVCMTKLDFEATKASTSEHTALAKAYGIPVVNVGAYMQSMYNSDNQFKTDWDNKVYLADGVHPSEDCSRIYGGYICNLISGNPDKYITLPKTNDSVTPLSDYIDYVYDYSAISENSDSVTFKVYGDDFRLQYYQNTKGVEFNVAIDGNDMGNINAKSSSDGNTNYSLMYTKEYSGLGDSWHTVTVSALEEGDVLIDTIKGVFKCESEELFEISKPIFNSQTITAGTELTASTSYTANAENKFTIIIALYNANGNLTGIKSSPVTTNTSCITTDANVSITPKDGDVSAKAFVWDSMSGMKSVTDMNKLGE